MLDIIHRFLHLEVEEKEIETDRGTKKIRKEKLIFPRYHQLDCVRKLVTDTKGQGVGKNYLVHHSAGSGKSNSIAWLAHRLSSLHSEKDKKIFSSIVVITDRVVLDKQLQDTIYQFEHKQGVVQKIEKDSTQLAQALDVQVPIIITTLQKFPFIHEKIGNLKGRTFAVIVDEAHSSQSGETAAEMKSILNKDGIEGRVKEQAEEEGVDAHDLFVLREMEKRGKQSNLSFYAFTATPKYKTEKLFNAAGPGTPPFHLYSMRQAIEEGFIMDVLKHYTTYRSYYGLIKKTEDDPELDKKKAARALARFLKLHPYSIAQKTEVMVEHFKQKTMHKIGGRAKAMVVTGSRLEAVRYKQSFDKYIADKGYDDIKTLVAFSGALEDPDVPGKQYTEVRMNDGIREKELPEKFGTDEVGTGIIKEEYVALSELVEILNDRFGTDFTEADQLFFDQLEVEATDNEKLQKAAKANTLEDFKFVFDREFEDLIIGRMEGNEDISTKLLNDQDLRQIAMLHMLKNVYNKIRDENAVRY